MAKDNKQKIKLLCLMELLRQETDETHPMLTSQICRRLGELGISCERRTVGMDVQVLNDFGFEVMKKMVGHENGYYVADRSFSVPEIKILMDAVQAAKFIPPGKSAALSDKLAALGGSHQAELLRGNLVCFNTRKHTNESILYNVQALEDAIREHRRASFRYFDLDENRRRVYRREGERYLVDPMALVYSEDYYYLLTYNRNHADLTTYRVDRMEQVRTEAESVCPEALVPDGDVNEYTAQVFRMFGGSPTELTLEFDRSLIGAVYDRFGEEAEITPVGRKKCSVTVTVQDSPVFRGWLAQFGRRMRIKKQPAEEAGSEEAEAQGELSGRRLDNCAGMTEEGEQLMEDRP